MQTLDSKGLPQPKSISFSYKQESIQLWNKWRSSDFAGHPELLAGVDAARKFVLGMDLSYEIQNLKREMENTEKDKILRKFLTQHAITESVSVTYKKDGKELIDKMNVHLKIAHDAFHAQFVEAQIVRLRSEHKDADPKKFESDLRIEAESQWNTIKSSSEAQDCILVDPALRDAAIQYFAIYAEIQAIYLFFKDFKRSTEQISVEGVPINSTKDVREGSDLVMAQATKFLPLAIEAVLSNGSFASNPSDSVELQIQRNMLRYFSQGGVSNAASNCNLFLHPFDPLYSSLKDYSYFEKTAAAWIQTNVVIIKPNLELQGGCAKPILMEMKINHTATESPIKSATIGFENNADMLTYFEAHTIAFAEKDKENPFHPLQALAQVDKPSPSSSGMDFAQQEFRKTHPLETGLITTEQTETLSQGSAEGFFQRFKAMREKTKGATSKDVYDNLWRSFYESEKIKLAQLDKPSFRLGQFIRECWKAMLALLSSYKKTDKQPSFPPDPPSNTPDNPAVSEPSGQKPALRGGALRRFLSRSNGIPHSIKPKGPPL